MFRKAISTALLPLLWLTASADEPQSIVAKIQSGGKITISQPAELDSLLQRPAALPDDENRAATANDSKSTRPGYRILLFEDNDPLTARRSAETYHNRMQTDYPSIRSYISFNSPYWRVKAGDFRTRIEAETMLTELKDAFPKIAPYMRIVRDKVNSFD